MNLLIAQKRIHQFISRKHVLITELATRFLADSNLHQIAFTADISDGYNDFDQVLMIRKNAGRYVIQEYTINKNHHVVVSDSITVTHNYKEVITVINNAIDYYSLPTALINQYGYYAANLKAVQFAEK